MNNDQKIQQLEQQVRELMAWKEQKTRQQISFPLDQTSKDIIQKDIPVSNGVFAEDGVNYTGMMCKVNGVQVAIQVAQPSIYE